MVDKKLWFNTAVTGNTSPCTQERICVCKDGPVYRPGVFSDTTSLFTSDSPVFMPADYTDAVKLRLKLNIIFFEEETPKSFKLVDRFAVANGPPIALHLADWHPGQGVSLHRNIYRAGLMSNP